MGLELSIKVDYGCFNLTKAAGWITSQLYSKYGMDSQFHLVTANAGKESVKSVVNREVDLAMITPVPLGEMAVKGIGMFEQAHPELRAIATLPHHDQHVLVVKRDSGLHSYEDVFKPARPLTVISALRDGDNLMGATFDKLLEIFETDFETWRQNGGRYIGCSDPHIALTEMMKGDADAMFMEAFMIPAWWELLEKVDLQFLSLPKHCQTNLQEWGCRFVTLLPDGRKGFDQPIVTLDWSGWMLLGRADLEDHVAASIAEIIVTKHSYFEAQYSHIPPRQSSLRYPIRETDFVLTGDVQLHSAAQAVYEKYGLFDK